MGLRRIDAALDALRPMGFAEDLVRSTISELLEVSVFKLLVWLLRKLGKRKSVSGYCF